MGTQLSLESNTFTPLLKRLEAGGLAIRQHDAADERVVRVSLTNKGRDLAKAASCVPGRILEATGLERAEIKHLNRTLVRLRDNLRGAQP
ncbi:MarR family winged helix-turn-helix transcriptional regulator [Novosphingobium profundi]|uniref:MarR family winged helix-turn-helix transcriptional regulator n=1 Tax=Novosphingobium profundi TaxID=1774954 RepID=UPI0031BB5624